MALIVHNKSPFKLGKKEMVQSIYTSQKTQEEISTGNLPARTSTWLYADFCRGFAIMKRMRLPVSNFNNIVSVIGERVAKFCLDRNGPTKNPIRS